MNAHQNPRLVQTGEALLRSAFAPVSTWAFDLDDTLYPYGFGLHRQMKDRVVAFISRLLGIGQGEAEKVHLNYYDHYGATLQGLVELHNVSPWEFLDFVHDIDLSRLGPDVKLRAALAALPGRRIVFTNGSCSHAEAVLAVLQIKDLFESVCHIENCGFVGKPQPSAYEAFVSLCAVHASKTAMFDDRIKNLVIPSQLGMRTVLVIPAGAETPVDAPGSFASDFITNDLASFLMNVAGALNGVTSSLERASIG
jgi:putative hydrolase of the HAD superfamily